MSVRGPYAQAPNLAPPVYNRRDYNASYFSPSLSTSSSSSSASSASTSPYASTTYYSPIPANHFEGTSAQPSTRTASRSASAPTTSYYRATDTAGSERRPTRGDGRYGSQRLVEQPRGPSQIEDDEAVAWRVHEEELAALQTEKADLQNERDFQQALEESRRMAELDALTVRFDKSGPSRSVPPGRTPRRAVTAAGSDGSPIPRKPQLRNREAASTSQPPPVSSFPITQRASPSHPLQEYRPLLSGYRKCSQCDAKIPVYERRLGSTLSPTSKVSIASLLHMTCPSCSATQCRGCSKAVRCPRRCTGGQQCSLTACCSEVRAIAIFEVLVDFDQAFAEKVAELHAHSPSQRLSKVNREVHLELATSWVDGRVSEHLNVILLATLPKLIQWLPGDLHASAALLISTSHLLEVIQSYLSVSSASDWLTRHALYGKILDFLRCLATRHTLHALVMSPRQDTQRTCGLQSIMRSATYLEDASPETTRSLYEAISNTCLKAMERYAWRAHTPQLGQDAQVLWQGLKYLELVKVSGSDTD